MSRTLVQVSGGVAKRQQAAIAKRIRYLRTAPAETKTIHSFRLPHQCVAVEQDLELSTLATESVGQDSTDHLDLVLLPTEAVSEARKLDESWITASTHDGATLPVSLAAGSCKVRWRPGRAIIQGPAERSGEVVQALAVFAFYEGELRRLENEIEKEAVGAPADVARAFRVRLRDRNHWPRIRETIERCYQARLTYSGLESGLATACQSLPRDSQPMMDRLMEESGIEDRLEALSNRLEACEDLYEGASDRISDHRWYLEGHLLEITIIVLLVCEVALMATDLYLKHLR